MCLLQLGHFGYQRPSKADRFSEAGLSQEVADVIIAAWELVEMLGGSLAAPLAAWTATREPGLRDVAGGILAASGIDGPAPRRRVLRSLTRIQEDARRLSAGVADHFAYESREAYGVASRA